MLAEREKNANEMIVSNLYMYIHVSARTFVRLYAHSYIHTHTRARVQGTCVPACARARYYKCYTRLNKLLLIIIAVDYVATARTPIGDDL